MEIQEQIDRYLLDQLNKADRAKFEQLMDNDSSLKEEVNLQQSIVKALGETRSLQLKARLQNVPVSMSGGLSNTMKWVGLGAAASIIAGLIIFLMPSAQNTAEDNTIATEITVAETEVSSIEKVSPQKEESSSLPEVVAVENKTLAAKKTAVSSTTSITEAYEGNTDLADAETEGLSQPNQGSNNLPSSNLSGETNTRLSNLSVTIDATNLAEKSYQFSGAKLTLYGDFNNSPYELLELNNKGQKNLFLSHQNDYYELIWGKTSKTPLKKVTHAPTLEKLKTINR